MVWPASGYRREGKVGRWWMSGFLSGPLELPSSVNKSFKVVKIVYIYIYIYVYIDIYIYRDIYSNV